jgi:hypothetical protein
VTYIKGVECASCKVVRESEARRVRKAKEAEEKAAKKRK